jgi:hypothetical protein
MEAPLADVPTAFPETLPPAPTGSGIDADRRLRFLREQLYITLRAYPYLPSDGFVERPEQVALWESRNPWPQLWDTVAVLEGFATAKRLIAATPRVEEVEGGDAASTRRAGRRTPGSSRPCWRRRRC